MDTQVFCSRNQNVVNIKSNMFEAVKKFITTSQLSQIQYANFSFFNQYKNKFSMEDINLIPNYITYILVCNPSNKNTNEENLSKLCNVKQIIQKINELNAEYNLNEIHLSVVWICYFNFERKTAESMPLFKVYKSRFANQAVFFDINSNFYDDWNCFLGNPPLPMSFVCVPRDGKYTIEGLSDIDLEYFFYNPREDALKSLMPYSGSERQSLIIKIENFINYWGLLPGAKKIFCKILKIIRSDESSIISLVLLAIFYNTNPDGSLPYLISIANLILQKLRDQNIQTSDSPSIDTDYTVTENFKNLREFFTSLQKLILKCLEFFGNRNIENFDLFCSSLFEFFHQVRLIWMGWKTLKYNFKSWSSFLNFIFEGFLRHVEMSNPQSPYLPLCNTS